MNPKRANWGSEGAGGVEEEEEVAAIRDALGERVRSHGSSPSLLRFFNGSGKRGGTNMPRISDVRAPSSPLTVHFVDVDIDFSEFSI